MNVNIADDKPSGTATAPGPASAPAPAAARRPGSSWPEAAGLVVVAAALGWAYAPNLQWLYHIWANEPDYSHGFAVLPIALWIFWKRRPGPADPRPSAWLPGWTLVAVALAARAVFLERGQNWLEAATLLPAVFGLGLARLGWPAMARAWPAFAFLVFLLPLPPQINSALSQPLQSFATTCACALLKLTGLWVMPEGNVILVGNERLEVAAACNGLSMLMSLAATVAAAAALVPMSNLKRLALLLTIIPIALVSNVLRITATAWAYHAFGADVGSKYAHDWAGLLMMPTAMLLVGLELAVISWLIIESEVDERAADQLGLGLAMGPRKLKGPS